MVIPVIQEKRSPDLEPRARENLALAVHQPPQIIGAFLARFSKRTLNIARTLLEGSYHLGCFFWKRDSAVPCGQVEAIAQADLGHVTGQCCQVHGQLAPMPSIWYAAATPAYLPVHAPEDVLL
jgi:hypothetical protein